MISSKSKKIISNHHAFERIEAIKVVCKVIVNFLHFNLQFLTYLSVSILILSLRLALLNEAKEVRAAGLRALRYLIRDTTVLQKVLRLQVDYLIAR